MAVKKVFWLMILIVVCSGFIGAEAKQLVKTEKWTLKECLDWALGHHLDLQMLDYDLQDAEQAWQKIRLADPQRVVPKDLEQREEAVAQAQQNLLDQRMQLCMDVQAGYFQVLRSIQTLAGKERQLAWVEKQDQIVQVKYESGLVPEKDWIAMQERRQQIQEEYADTLFRLETSQLEFNLTLGRGLDQELILPADEQFSFKVAQVELDESIAAALRVNPGVILGRVAVVQAKEKLELRKKMQVAQMELEALKHALTKAEWELQKVKDQLVLRVRNTFLSLQIQGRGVVQGQKEVQKAEKRLEVLQVKYEAGMISLLELLDGHSELADAETQLIQQNYDYHLAKNAYYQLIGAEEMIQQFFVVEGQE